VTEDAGWEEGVRAYWAAAEGVVRAERLRGYLQDYGAPRWVIVLLRDMAETGLLREIAGAVQRNEEMEWAALRWQRNAADTGMPEEKVRAALRVWVTAVGGTVPASLRGEAAAVVPARVPTPPVVVASPASAPVVVSAMNPTAPSPPASHNRGATAPRTSAQVAPQPVTYRIEQPEPSRMRSLATRLFGSEPMQKGSLEIPMMRLPAGRFQMGSPASDQEADPLERPQHWVELTRPFELGVYPVTNEQWCAVMGGTPPGYWKGTRRPVEMVSALDAEAFCKQLHEMLGGAAFRLPSEAEWEYACRAGTTAPRYGRLDEIAWYADNSGGQTQDVGGKAPNAWGLYDMLGNVWEWTSDMWRRGYEETPQARPVKDPRHETGSYRVRRGGSWSGGASYVRSAVRRYYTPGSRSHGCGFRLARSSP
jgi:formylglycine-generating enzyme required for sulfatase activity